MIETSAAAPAAPTLEHLHGIASQLLAGAAAALALPPVDPVIGAIELPAAAGSPDDQAHLQVVAPLYLAADMEAAGLLRAAETLAGLFISGGFDGDVGVASGLLQQLWQGRHQRFTAAERGALFARLFGEVTGPTLAVAGAVNQGFLTLMIDLTEAIHRLPPAGYQVGAGEGTVREAGVALAANLGPRSGGIAAFAAGDILGTMHLAIQILKVPALQHALGAHTLWDAVRATARTARGVDISPVSHVDRGRSGMTVLSWLAGSLPALDQPSSRLVPDGSPVREAATAWLQSSLALAEATTPRPSS